jgi:hypothetical protein
MMTHKTVEDAAAAAGISPATAYRWMQDPVVVQRLAQVRRDGMKAAISKLQQAASQAVDCLSRVLSEGESESAKVSAARCILEQALRATELSDVIERLDAIERTVKSQGQGVTPGPRVSLTYEHEKDGKGSSHDGQNHKAPFRGTGGSHEQ